MQITAELDKVANSSDPDAQSDGKILQLSASLISLGNEINDIIFAVERHKSFGKGMSTSGFDNRSVEILNSFATADRNQEIGTSMASALKDLASLAGIVGDGSAIEIFSDATKTASDVGKYFINADHLVTEANQADQIRLDNAQTSIISGFYEQYLGEVADALDFASELGGD